MRAEDLILMLSAGRGEIDDKDLAEAAALNGLSLLQAQKAALKAGVWPARYARNASTLKAADQLRLLEARVLQVGLGGLGGYVLEILARLGVGRITALDGDAFEPRNLNRQLLCVENTMGRPKAGAAAERVALVNPAVEFKAVPAFADARMLGELCAQADLVIDALGGLKDRKTLQNAAAGAGIPMISAGIAGLSGWVAAVMPGETGPADHLGAGSLSGDGVEVETGSLAPAVCAAAAMQCSEALNALLGRPTAKGALFFDLGDLTFMRARPS